jgi:general secretion pathway protein K
LRLELMWDARHLDILIADQSKKIDVNRASAQKLAEGFEALGFDAQKAAALAARAIDWRDPDDKPQPRGAEADAYAAAGLLSPPRNDRFVSLDEVGTLLGMPPDGNAKLRERFAVTRALVPIAQAPAGAVSMAGLDRQAPAAAASDGITRAADVAQGTWDFDVEVRVRRDGEEVERVHLGASSD